MKGDDKMNRMELRKELSGLQDEESRQGFRGWTGWASAGWTRTGSGTKYGKTWWGESARKKTTIM